MRNSLRHGLLAIGSVALSTYSVWGDEQNPRSVEAPQAASPISTPDPTENAGTVVEPKEMPEAVREWLNHPGSAAFGHWVAATVGERPDAPEWLLMFADILQGSQLGPRDGWFRRAVSETRFTWSDTLERWDQNQDGLISSSEFPGCNADFQRLDRNGNGVLDEEDFDWSPHALSYSPGLVLYYMMDRDGNGKVTPDEWQAWFGALDREQRGFVSQEEFRELFAAMERGRGGDAGNDEGPSKATLIQGLFRQEIGSLQPGPALHATAPDFTLQTAQGDRSITLSAELGERPVVLVFGNITCGPFRGRAGDVEKLYQRYRDRATFLMIYVREAHPTDGWHMEINARVQVALAQPTTYSGRAEVAQTCRRLLDFEMPFLVDTIEDTVGTQYSGMPSRLYVLDLEGRVAYKSGRGPFGFKPGEMEQSLLLLLAAGKPLDNLP